ncbi:MAG TPA: tetratricopeptide repeat protein [Pyrinomonadaceae bacterium]|nr:tetratricopeptide repeat protein [Pyrinomonadaceae bacterium]
MSRYLTAAKFRPAFLIIQTIILCGLICETGWAQASTQTLFGDFKVNETGVETPTKPLSYQLVLYADSGVIAARQTISNGGRYRFMNLPNGVFYLAVEHENSEIARFRVELLRSYYKADFRQDIELEWRSILDSKHPKPANISAEDNYVRTSPNQQRFEKAKQAADARKNDEAVILFKNLLTEDQNDFQAWTELGTAYLAQNNLTESEKAYVEATRLNPKFFLGQLNLGRLRILQKNFEGAIAALTEALGIKPESALANYYLGESYLQIRKGSKAVGYLNEALRLDPVGRAEAHLRLAALYDGAGLKEKAVTEYEEFLKKKPGYADKKKLEQYIAQNKKK